MFVIIAAIGENRELGKNNQLIWSLPSDLAFFKVKTTGKKIVMGRKTFESLPRFLPNRQHYVFTYNDTKDLVTPIPNVEELIKEEKIVIVNNFDKFVGEFKDSEEDIFIIGGEAIYKKFIDISDKMYLTKIKATDKEADAFFPEFDENEWNTNVLDQMEENGIEYEHIEYVKK